MLIGYARVSTSDQNLDLQLNALNEAGCERIFTDKTSGTKKDRQGLSDALEFSRSGDCLVVWKLDRLGRSMKGLIDLAATLDEQQIDLRSLSDGIDTKTAAGRFFFNIMSSLAVMERDLMLERTKAGLDAAKKAGRFGGRPPVMTPTKTLAAKELRAQGIAPKDIAANLGISIATLYRYLPKV